MAFPDLMSNFYFKKNWTNNADVMWENNISPSIEEDEQQPDAAH